MRHKKCEKIKKYILICFKKIKKWKNKKMNYYLKIIIVVVVVNVVMMLLLLMMMMMMLLLMMILLLVFLVTSSSGGGPAGVFKYTVKAHVTSIYLTQNNKIQAN